MAVMVKGLKNGPLEISGGVKVSDYNGKEYAEAGDPVYLCRWGQSNAKPYCDGSHEGVGFNLNPTFFQTGSAREPYNRGQWGSALRSTAQATIGDVTDGRGLQTTCTFTCPRFPASLASLTDW